ncbi:MAG: MerR family transcriptional regulator, partial [Actinobacteria bacterium]|nr:MerR family transcriptional regulator [Actinomycetota bacterium]
MLHQAACHRDPLHLSARECVGPLERLTEQTYSLKEVATQVGVDLRVLRSWMGHPYRILPGFGRGSGTRYPQAFLDRAKLAQRLRDEHLPLAEVANRLRGVPDHELEQLLNGALAPSGRTS